jgi:lipopolysaccharide/colanic/teichoic acid biosynthesis glycosyltransferase
LASIPILREAVPDNPSQWQMVSLFERAAAAALLALALPVSLCVAFAIWAHSRRTPLIAHRRVGRQGSTLWMLKLRTMWETEKARPEKPRATRSSAWIEYIDDDHGPAMKGRIDPRVPGAFARFLRRHSIDEIPQLWHVLSGEMSLVGPRPMTGRELQQYYGIHAGEVLLLKPGMTGLWQTSGRNRLTFAERRDLDLELVRSRSLGLYFGILLRTFPEIFRGQNSW